MNQQAIYHLPGLFEFHELYKLFLPLFFEHTEYFYDWCKIGSIYGAPAGCLWGGGRIPSDSEANAGEVLALLSEYGISARLTFSNSLLKEEQLGDRKCNHLCSLLNNGNGIQNGIIIHSDLLLDYLKNRFSNLYFVSSTTKVLTDFNLLEAELNRKEFKYVVPDFRLNKVFNQLIGLTPSQKEKTEFLCNECCWVGCQERKECYETVSAKSLGIDREHICQAPGGQGGYSFSSAMRNPMFISRDDIEKIYLPMGFSNFKIEGRGLGSALVLEFLLYYMTKPEYQINVREALYLDSMLDLF